MVDIDFPRVGACRSWPRGNSKSRIIMCNFYRLELKTRWSFDCGCPDSTNERCKNTKLQRCAARVSALFLLPNWDRPSLFTAVMKRSTISSPSSSTAPTNKKVKLTPETEITQPTNDVEGWIKVEKRKAKKAKKAELKLDVSLYFEHEIQQSHRCCRLLSQSLCTPMATYYSDKRLLELRLV